MSKVTFILIVMAGLITGPAVSQQTNDRQASINQRLQEAAMRDRAAQQALEYKKNQQRPSVLAAQLPTTDQTVALEDGDKVFGEQLFTGRFARQQFVGFNPNYEIATGDRIALQMWGGFETQLQLTVDAQGNIFLPKVGPLMVRGVRNKDLNSHVTKAIGKTFKSNVGVYASLLGAEPVKVFVTGFVKKPGLYAGHSSDSVLRFIDLAGGIDKKRGSFIDIELLRNGQLLHQVNLYDFLLKGRLPSLQIFDGDTILLKPVQYQVGVEGLVQNPYIFEFNRPEVAVREVLDIARPTSKATHVRINRNNRPQEEVEYYALSDLDDVMLNKGDVVEVTTDKLPGTIAVRVEGEHLSGQEHILPYGSSLLDLMQQIKMGANALPNDIQLFRESVKTRQKDMLMAQLEALEKSLLTARSATVEEAALRTQEAALVMRWVERAKKEVEPKGQVVLGSNVDYSTILLEANDVIRVPRKSNLISVHGDVMFPTSMAFKAEQTPQDYIRLAGGFVQGSSGSVVLILHQDGTFDEVKKLDSRKTTLKPGDEIFILPKVETKYLQTTKDITQVLYQIAVGAGVLLRI